MTYRSEWQAARMSLVTAGFSDERIAKLLVEEPKESVDPVTNVPRNDFEALHSFQKLMWQKLMVNSHKGGWSGLTVSFLLERLKKETAELQHELREMEGAMYPSAVAMHARNAALECADVANFAMFIADVLGQLEYKRRSSAG